MRALIKLRFSPIFNRISQLLIMQFEFCIDQLFNGEITKLDSASIRQESQFSRRSFAGANIPQSNENESLWIVIDRMGDASAKAQGLNHSITTYKKMCESDHILYIMKDTSAVRNDAVIGILKVGKKKLYLVDTHGHQHEMLPVCILDFYIHENHQRKGCGKRLFDFMLKDQSVEAYQLAIDRPSPKLISFLTKHYQLSDPIQQRNHFTVYEGIFSKIPTKCETDITKKQKTGRHSDSGRRPESEEEEDKPARSLYRQSFPPSIVKQGGSNSVASVVFGQTFSNGYHENDENRLEIKHAEHPRSHNAMNRHPVDSSFNIFGIPSQMTRY